MTFPAPYVLPPLQAPIWNPQVGESYEEYAAFKAWYWGSGTKKLSGSARDWQAVYRIGYTNDQARALSIRWAWDTRGKEFDLANAELVKASRGELKASVDDLLAHQASAARELGTLFVEELKKLIELSRTTPAQVLDAKDLVRLGTLFERMIKGLDQATAKSVPVSTEQGTDWGQLSVEELEQARTLFTKVRETAT